jgi:hypothetical protein
MLISDPLLYYHVSVVSVYNFYFYKFLLYWLISSFLNFKNYKVETVLICSSSVAYSVTDSIFHCNFVHHISLV